ncbi:DUF4393 domain-containing protein [Pseudomonas koreensis]|uniref:DUF4393 domain-containing protein n=1 Tax=Pseudomonas koreensis TaxID=198620 RepID=UPI0018E6BAD1|nr:DUF4393 domain-containing protein [Pseudomonas koreensis]MBI6947315.1 DUF4393 domain-containing protein [Pseudomonas koreensis]
MGEEASGDNKVKETIEAVTGLVKAVPVYEDAVQPAAKQIGKSLETIGKAINVALAPVGMLVWGYEKCQEFISTKVADRLKDVPPEDIITPKPNVAGPAIEALRYTGHEESLSDMYANLLAAAMDKSTADGAHPAFVEIIKQLTPDEAKLIAYFMRRQAFPIVSVRADNKEMGQGGYDVAVNVSLFGQKAELALPDLVPSYLDNLARLGLIDIRAVSYSDVTHYNELESSGKLASYKAEIELSGHIFNVVRGGVSVTNLGNQFGRVCVNGHPKTSENPA